MQSAVLQVNVFNGRRELILDRQILFNITDGHNRRVVQQEYHTSGQQFAVPFYDDGTGNVVVVHADGYGDSGFMPVYCTPDAVTTLDLMLIPKNAGYTYAPWDSVVANHPEMARLLRRSADDTAAAMAYGDLKEKGGVLACAMNLMSAMDQIQLQGNNTALSYFKELIWDKMAEDRFFAWADPALYPAVLEAAKRKLFAREAGFGAFHDGATDSYKQVQFGEANVQLTFHQNDKHVVGGLECIMMEPDIDYYTDPVAHLIFEVGVNHLTHTVTDPRQAYMLRWIAGRHAGLPPFQPPYTIG